MKIMIWLFVAIGSTACSITKKTDTNTKVDKMNPIENSHEKTNTHDPSHLLGKWIVTKVETLSIEKDRLRFEFDKNAKHATGPWSEYFSVFGEGPCRSFRGKLNADNGGFSLMFDEPHTDTKTCPKDDHREYKRILDRLSHYEIKQDGTLVLSSFGTAMIYATREK